MAPFGEFPGSAVAGAAGAGGSVPKNLVLGGASESVTSIIVPGISGSPDVQPGTPSLLNDEFDENAAGVPSGWTSTASIFGTLPTCNTNDILSHVHMIGGAGALANGIFKAAPTSFPFTMIAKLTDGMVTSITGSTFPSVGVYMGAQAPGVAGNLFAISLTGQGGPGINLVQTNTVTSATGALGGGTTWGQPGVAPLYFKIVVTATTISRFWSYNGLTWFAVSPTTGLTIANPFCGLFVNTSGGSQAAEAAFDFVRFF